MPTDNLDPAAAPVVVVENAAPVVSTPTPPAGEAAAAAPLSPPAPSAAAAPAPADGAAPAAATEKPAGTPAEAPAAEKPANEFKPSLLDAAPAAAAKDGEAKPGEKPAEKAEAKPGEAKPADAAKPAEPGKEGAPAAEAPAPIEYAFTYPEGLSADSINKERMSAFTGTLNEARVPPETAQKMLDLHLKEVGEIGRQLAQKQWDAFNATNEKWREEVLAHPVLGGARHQTAVNEIMSVVDRYAGTAEERTALLDVFRTTGVANNPAFLTFLHRAALDLAKEGTPHPASPPKPAAPSAHQRGLSRYNRTTPAQAAR